MTKDEMKNRISMALKDPMLQQGFEIVCKNLVELEKENAKLKEIIKGLITPLTEDELHLTITHQQVAYMKAKKILEKEIKEK